MTRDDISRMAREAGIVMRSHEHQTEPTKLERFAALVAAAEREAILQMSRAQWFKTQADFETAIRARGKK
jgi:hypothetical protein